MIRELAEKWYVDDEVAAIDRALPAGAALLRSSQIREAIDISADTIGRLGQSGKLDRVRLTPGPTGQVRYTRQSVLDLVRTWSPNKIAKRSKGKSRPVGLSSP